MLVHLEFSRLGN